MRKLSVVLLLAVAVVAAAGSAGQTDASWTGYITDTHCGAQKDFSKHASCAKKCVEGGSGKYALYTPGDKKIYVLEPGEKAAEFSGKQVKVTGKLAGETITVTTIAAVEAAAK